MDKYNFDFLRPYRQPRALGHKIHFFDTKDFLFLIAVVASSTVIISFFTISYLYNLFGSDPLILKVAIVILSGLCSFLFLILLRVGNTVEDLSAPEVGRKGDKLARSLRANKTIQEATVSTGVMSRERSAMSTRYPITLVRVFVLGIAVTAFGLVLTLAGIAIGHFGAQFGGSAFLAIGVVCSTLSVIRGENVYRQLS